MLRPVVNQQVVFRLEEDYAEGRYHDHNGQIGVVLERVWPDLEDEDWMEGEHLWRVWFSDGCVLNDVQENELFPAEESKYGSPA